VTSAAVFLVVALAGTQPGSGQAAPETRFSDALTRARSDLETPEGHDYDHVLSVFFREQNVAVLGACFKSTPTPEKDPFELVFHVDGHGGVLDALVWPETNIGRCLRDGLKAKTFPAPPRDSFWAQQRMSFGR